MTSNFEFIILDLPPKHVLVRTVIMNGQERGGYGPMSATIISNDKLQRLKITNAEWNRELEVGRPYDPINKAFICVNRPSSSAENSTSLAIGLTEKEAVQTGKHLCKLGGLDVDKLEADAGIAKLNVDRLSKQAELKDEYIKLLETGAKTLSELSTYLDRQGIPTRGGADGNFFNLLKRVKLLKRRLLLRASEEKKQPEQVTADNAKNDARCRHDSEELESIKMWLNKNGVDKADSMGCVYSPLERIKLKEAANIISEVIKAQKNEKDALRSKVTGTIDSIISRLIANKATYALCYEHQKAAYAQEHIDAAKHIKGKLYEALK